MKIVIEGYDRFKVRDARVVALEACADEVREAMKDGTLYDFARSQPGARALMGRVPAYAVRLGSIAGDVVVRHSTRGGMVAKLVTDRYVAPTRGIVELLNSERLRTLGVRTPRLIAYVVYPAGPMLRRLDVATREVPNAYDLAEVFSAPLAKENKHEALAAVSELIGSLTHAGAHHADLNLKNIVLSREADVENRIRAFVLDVDRVRFNVPGDPLVAQANMQRLMRSLEKVRSRGEIFLEEADIRWLERRAMEMRG
ncbi:MAG: hypothetical protein H0U64_11405 [Gemmatimonadaceae bacterium]|nr:hypothetical protein [Gemmatimonadaceae bacterium]